MATSPELAEFRAWLEAQPLYYVRASRLWDDWLVWHRGDTAIISRHPTEADAQAAANRLTKEQS